MNALGLFGFGMNPGACLLRDGRLIAVAEEERFVRAKAAPGMFPGHAAEFCLRRGGLELGDVDRIAFAWDARKYPYRMLRTLARQYLRYRGRLRRTRSGSGTRAHDGSWGAALSNLIQYTPGRLEQEIRLGLRAQGLSGPVPEIEFVPHHLCHAYSAYFCSPFQKAVVLSFDGSGEDVCTQVAIGRGEDLEVVETIPIPHSLGWFYAAFTAYFGFTPYRHEGKLMGVAAHGHARREDNPWVERLSQVLRVEKGGYEVDPTFTKLGNHSFAERFTDSLAELVTGYDSTLRPVVRSERGSNGMPYRYLEPAYVDLAWAVQHKIEEAARAVAAAAAERYGIRHACVSGGVGLNCKLNGSLLAGGRFDEVFVQPASHDAGAAIGAAMVVAREAGDSIRNTLRNAYYGPSFSGAEIERVLASCKVSAERCDDVAARAALELSRGRTVGWFQGGMELGPRALGARSILANPCSPGVCDELNRLKGRESWRPFCPAILDEVKDDYLVDAREAPFMTTTFRVRDERREEMAAAVHVDGSVRPQTVSADGSPDFHRLLGRFRELTGTPFLVNTSFNVGGEPIVCTPIEALRSFYASGLDVLALGDYLLTKT